LYAHGYLPFLANVTTGVDFHFYLTGMIIPAHDDRGLGRIHLFCPSKPTGKFTGPATRAELRVDQDRFDYRHLLTYFVGSD
jgi:hypothetical protein